MPDQHLLHTEGVRENLYRNGRHCGTRITVFDSTGTKPLVVTLMDTLNRIIERRFHADDATLAQRHEFLYSLDGRLRRKQIFDIGDRLIESIFVDGNGQVIKTEKLTYDAASGKLSMAATYSACGLLQQKESHDGDGRCVRSLYDGDGKLAETVWHDCRGVMQKKLLIRGPRDGGGKLEFDYLRDGALLEARCYDADHRLMQVDNYHATGHLTRNAYYENGQLAEISYLDAEQRVTRRVVLQYDTWGICVGKQDLHYPDDECSGGISGYDMGCAARDDTCDDEGNSGCDDMPPCQHAMRRARRDQESIDVRITNSPPERCADQPQERNTVDAAPLVTERLFHDDRGRLMQRERWPGKGRISHREIYFYRRDAYIGKKIIVYRYAGLLAWLGTDKLARRHATVDVYDADGNLLLHKDRYWLVW